MKVIINQDKLSKALNYVSRAVSVKPNIPVLSNVLLEVNSDSLMLSATNLDMGINMWIAGKVEEDGKVTASGKFLSDFVSAAGGEKVQVSLVKDVLNVQTENSNAQFNTIPATEFPILPKISGEPLFVVPATELLDAINKVIFACSTDMGIGKMNLTGVLFELEAANPKQLTMVSTDGFRLSRKILNIFRANEEAMQLIIPAKPLQELVKMLSTEDVSEVEFYLSESKSQAIFKVNEIELSIRLLEGPFVEYKRVIPEAHEYSFDVSKAEFDRALRIVNTFARTLQGYKMNMDLDLENKAVIMSTKVMELGINETKLEVSNITGSQDLKDAYNLQYLMEMVAHMNGARIKFETNGPLAAAVFTEDDDQNYIHLVMPLQRTD